MKITLKTGNTDDAAEIVALRTAVIDELTSQHGKGPWSMMVSEKRVLFDMRTSALYIARHRGKLIASLTLSTKKPWAIDKRYFSACSKPLYLTWVAIAPRMQRKGVGILCIEQVRRIAKKWPSDAIRLDTYDHPGGAGDFYRKCGFREVGRASYRNTPLIYFEMLM